MVPDAKRPLPQAIRVVYVWWVENHRSGQKVVFYRHKRLGLLKKRAVYKTERLVTICITKDESNLLSKQKKTLWRFASVGAEGRKAPLPPAKAMWRAGVLREFLGGPKALCV